MGLRVARFGGLGFGFRCLGGWGSGFVELGCQVSREFRLFGGPFHDNRFSECVGWCVLPGHEGKPGSIVEIVAWTLLLGSTYPKP